MEQSSVTDTASQATQKKVSSWGGIVQVFVKPGEFFRTLGQQPKVLVPYIVIVILAAVAAYLSVPVITDLSFSDPHTMEQLQKQAERTGQSPEDMIAMAKKFAPVSIGSGIVVARLLAPLVMALLVLVFANFVMGGQASFKQVLSLSLYAEVIFAAGFFITAILMALKGGMVTFSPAILVIDNGMKSLSFVTLSQLSLFNIWEAIVLGIGVKQIYGFSGNKGYTVSVLSIGTMVLISIGFAALGTAIGG